MSEPPVVVERGGGIARLVLNRPTAGNSIDVPLADAFGEAVADLAADASVRVIVLAGRGPMFCAGGDIQGMAASDDVGAYLRDLAARMHAGLERLARAPQIVIAAVHGSVAGAGNGLVMLSDIAIAASGVTLRSAYAGVGLTPDCGVSYLLPRTVGIRRAKRFALAGTVLTASDALEWGMVDEVVEPDDLDARVDALATSIATGAWPALGRTADLLDRSWLDGYAEHLALEARTLGEMAETDASRERVSAFVERATQKAGAR